MATIDYILLVISVFYIILITIQPSKDDASNAFSGEKAELFDDKKERGSELMMTRITTVMTALFITTAFLASFARELMVNLLG